VLIPDNKWWLAQNIKYAGAGSVHSASGCTPDKCGRLYSGAQMSSTYTGSTGASGYGENKQGVCPNNWNLPTSTNWRGLADAISTITYTAYSCGSVPCLLGTSDLICKALTRVDNPIASGTDLYGWANGANSLIDDPIWNQYDAWRGNDNSDQLLALLLNHKACVTSYVHGYVSLCGGVASEPRLGLVRCYRQL
jgi:uncharacterized protein (TIGR02145 family)